MQRAINFVLLLALGAMLLRAIQLSLVSAGGIAQRLWQSPTSVSLPEIALLPFTLMGCVLFFVHIRQGTPRIPSKDFRRRQISMLAMIVWLSLIMWRIAL